MPRRPRSRSARPWRNKVFSVCDGFDLLVASERRQLGHRVRTLLLSQSQELAIALRERFLNALGGREPDRQLPLSQLVLPADYAMVLVFTLS